MQKALGKMLSLGDRSMPGVGVAGGKSYFTAHLLSARDAVP